MSDGEAAFPIDQYEALRSGCGYVELAGWSSVTLTGGDRQSFLNNFATNEMKGLAPGEHRETFITNVKGKVLGHGLVTCRDDELVFVTVPGQAEPLIAHLDRYVIREDAQLADTSQARAYVLVAGGDAARKAAEAIGDCGLRVVDWDVAGGKSKSVNRDWLAVGNGYSGLVEVCSENLGQLMAALTESGAITCESKAFDAARIEAGLPLYGVDFNAENLPQEVGRDAEAISFTKGCYLGQETVARIDALGHVNRQIVGVGFSAEQVPDVGMLLTHDGTEVGRVTSASYSPQFKGPLALAMLRRGHNAAGTKLQSPAGDAEVVALPL